MARTHLAGWRAIGEEIVGVYGSSHSTAATLAREEAFSLYESFEELVANCDIVDVCTPTYSHKEYVTVAAEAGKAVFCEKPMALSVADAKEMIRVAEKNSAPLGVGHVLRFFPEYARAAETARSGELGDLAVLRFSRTTFAPKKAWYLDEELSGGVILDLMIHDLDFAQLVAGNVKRVFASIDRSGPGPHAYAILTHDSGALSHVEGSWRMPQPSFHTSFEIAGSTALLTFDSAESSALVPHITTVSSDQPAVPVAASPVSEDPYTAEIRAFRDAVGAHTTPPVNGAEGLAALKLALAARQSAAKGEPVEIDTMEAAS
jgi:predicted dehydrogenase